MPTTPFGRLLKRLRERAGLSQTALAERAGYDHSYVSRVERGDRFPSYVGIDDLVAAIAATHEERIALLHAAGYVIDVLREPALGELDRLLADPALDPHRRANAASAITSLLCYLTNDDADAPQDENNGARRDETTNVIANPVTNASGQKNGIVERELI
jgi:transcriptional regulator with XRE-family HTH domain